MEICTDEWKREDGSPRAPVVQVRGRRMYDIHRRTWRFIEWQVSGNIECNQKLGMSRKKTSQKTGNHSMMNQKMYPDPSYWRLYPSGWFPQLDSWPALVIRMILFWFRSLDTNLALPFNDRSAFLCPQFKKRGVSQRWGETDWDKGKRRHFYRKDKGAKDPNLGTNPDMNPSHSDEHHDWSLGCRKHRCFLPLVFFHAFPEKKRKRVYCGKRSQCQSNPPTAQLRLLSRRSESVGAGCKDVTSSHRL